MSKLVNHQEIIDSKKTNKERQKIQTNKKRHLLINIYVLLSFKTSSTPGPQTPKPQPSIRFWGNNKNPPAFRPRNSGLGEILRQIIELPNLDFSTAKNRPASLGDLHTDVFFLPRRHGCHVYTPAPPQHPQKKAGLFKTAWKNQETNWCFFVKIPPKGHL